MHIIILNIALAAIAVGILILVHELGHFLAAKAVGVRVEVFSIGFWKKLFSFRKGDTEYRLSVVPLGGYVKLAGEMEGEGSGEPDEFSSKSPGQRALVFIAGVAMNVLFALGAFIIAFTIGVPFEVAEVGRVERGSPAWEAGLMPGDKITRINNTQNPDFQDIQRHVALMGHDSIHLDIEREGDMMEFELVPRYDEFAGMKLMGFSPPVEPVVTGIAELENGRRPAEEAGIELEDRVLRINGHNIDYFRDIRQVLQCHEEGSLEIELLRNDERKAVELDPVKPERYVIGISGVNTEIKSLQSNGPAAQTGLQVGDKIVAVGQTPVKSIVGLESFLEENPGQHALHVERNGENITLDIEVADRAELQDFIFSLSTGSSNELVWVKEDGPSWEAGMRAGDVITHIGGQRVSSWEEILEANEKKGEAPREIAWERNGESFEEKVIPKVNRTDQAAQMGIFFTRTKQQVRREGVTGAISTGIQKTYGAFADMLFTIRGFATREVSTQHVGGIMLIAYASYHAASQGMGQLLYFSAMISVALAFLNILPIPVLDGGHLLFVGIEKLRGKPLSERIKHISQTVGLALLLLLVVYAVRNDILRLFNL